MAKRKAVSKKNRFEVFKRDSFICQYCGASSPECVLQVDHIKPVANGGDNSIANLITSCQPCNIGKGARELDDSSAMQRQKAQLDELNERREQLEMMSDWRNGLRNIESDECEAAAIEMDELIHPYSLNDTGKKKIARAVKRYGLTAVIAGIEQSCKYNIKHDESGDPTQSTVIKAVDNLTKAILFAQDPPHIQKIRYINGIARKRVRMSWEKQNNLKSWLLRIHEAGGSLDRVQEDMLQVEDIEDVILVVEVHKEMSWAG